MLVIKNGQWTCQFCFSFLRPLPFPQTITYGYWFPKTYTRSFWNNLFKQIGIINTQVLTINSNPPALIKNLCNHVSTSSIFVRFQGTFPNYGNLITETSYIRSFVNDSLQHEDYSFQNHIKEILLKQINLLHLFHPKTLALQKAVKYHPHTPFFNRSLNNVPKHITTAHQIHASTQLPSDLPDKYSYWSDAIYDKTFELYC